jgi:hypothetical protein
MIEPAVLSSVLDQVAYHTGDPDDVLVNHLRRTFPGLHFSVCRDDDMPPRLEPVTGNTFCRLYFVDSSAHCLQLTNDAESATGLAVALRDWDEE